MLRGMPCDAQLGNALRAAGPCCWTSSTHDPEWACLLQAPAPGPQEIQRSIDAAALPLSTGNGPKGPTLLDQDGNEVILKGLSVFGFNSV